MNDESVNSKEIYNQLVEITKQLQENGKHASKVSGLERLIDKVEDMSIKVDNLSNKIASIEKPDEGLYSRVRDIEKWKEGVVKIVTAIGTAVIGLIIKVAYDLLVK